ncbi:MAG: bifunctional UDP-N-acetylmuramoyl-tripeptide:D-alanyl-D-alanine ligase/alanine racemase, partial [Bacteroidaceae bacterium]|nr:bifunctional UDP-N-acetylmuramoyl-tripeptide:D-alanyl-D-alanine ligase/alanine racemase [Bacteroidaceae bacterium]
MQYTAGQIKEILKADGRLAMPESRVTRLLTDSRSLTFPEETLFFAIRTKHGDGHDYIRTLYNKGVRNFVVNDIATFSDIADANFILTGDSLAALQAIARHHRSQFDIPIVGITGSDGKTIVKEWLYQLTAGSYNVTRSPRSYNSQIGVPLSVWMLGKESTLGIFEAGISQRGEMGRLQQIIKPTIGIITNISGAHQENFTTLQQKCAEKLLLLKDCDIIIYNADNRELADCIEHSASPSREIAWSRIDAERPLYIES